MSITPLVAPPEVPSKYDIIPIHASDVSNFLRCRRYWDWSSPTRTNLRHRVELYGVNMPMWLGTGIHHALEYMYNPLLKRDPVETFQTWFQLQWFGGEVDENFLKMTYDPNPMPKRKIGMYQVRGLNDLLPDPDQDEWFALKELGIGMMEYYKTYAAKHDDFEVVAAESVFSVPLEFEAVDRREESPNYGKKIEVHLRGKRDAILYYPERKDPRTQFGIHDYKTAAKVDYDEIKLKLENDPQCTTYIMASIKEAEQHDLPWKTVTDIKYTVLRKVYPKPPTITTRGFPSISRSDESCTAEMFLETVKEIGLIDWYHNDPKAQAYYEFLLEEGEKRFIYRESAIRNEHQIKTAFEEAQMVASEMLDKELKIYKHPTGSSSCTRCAFRAPCLAKDDGSDWKEMLVQGYEQNRDR